MDDDYWMNRCEFEFFWPVRVYREDIDTQGSSITRISEIHGARPNRVDTRVGIRADRSARAGQRVILGVAEVGVKYHRPARFNDELTVGVRMTRLRAASMGLSHNVARGAGQELICHAEVTVACLDATTCSPHGHSLNSISGA